MVGRKGREDLGGRVEVGGVGEGLWLHSLCIPATSCIQIVDAKIIFTIWYTSYVDVPMAARVPLSYGICRRERSGGGRWGKKSGGIPRQHVRMPFSDVGK